MNNDNPAARLLSILEKGKQLPSNMNCRDAWQQLLMVESDNALLMSRLGKIMEFPEQIILALREGFPNQKNTWSHWSQKVNSGFIHQHLNSNWDTFINHIDDHSITYLALAADLLQSKSNTKNISDDEIKSVREKLSQIYDEILSADLPDEVKKYLIRYIRKILNGIDEYYLTGALPLLDAVDTMVGHAAIDANYRDFLRDTQLGSKILEALGAMANVVTVAVGIPQLTQTLVLLS